VQCTPVDFNNASVFLVVSYPAGWACFSALQYHTKYLSVYLLDSWLAKSSNAKVLSLINRLGNWVVVTFFFFFQMQRC
jgi:hypothetical protein